MIVRLLAHQGTPGGMAAAVQHPFSGNIHYHALQNPHNAANLAWLCRSLLDLFTPGRVQPS